jgi:hypothetical protein
MLDVSVGQLLWGNASRERGCHGGSPRAVERGALTRFAVMLVDDACPRQPPNWLW